MAEKKYKLKYFNARGVGEPARLMFALMGKEYEDIRYTSDQWKNEKANTQQGQLPILEVDEVVVPQSAAIYRYLAREFGLYGKSNLEATKIDVLIETLYDMRMSYFKFMMETDDKKKEEFRKAFEEETLPRIHGHVEQLCPKNGKYFLGDKVSLADIILLWHADGVAAKFKGSLDKFPKVKAIVNTMRNEEALKKWIAKRPVTDN